ncbi:hypothetical protein B0T26DRAFT_752427 [Lasiosphaeria miniovina]|uniref:Transmembrane protein n=1 Tax=Lasiosphaeria miniovina TaxID=1954250 RepID=A0AA40AME5_9PEZI|nr:uncharacterized protein B0T26DRAFT_752427 [Lasiosphaeria miniovina]KAK0718513.1 hypothetical protein B0T26DRAFT_752427 [Lasiosphaeria miniovina]
MASSPNHQRSRLRCLVALIWLTTTGLLAIATAALALPLPLPLGEAGASPLSTYYPGHSSSSRARYNKKRNSDDSDATADGEPVELLVMWVILVVLLAIALIATTGMLWAEIRDLEKELEMGKRLVDEILAGRGEAKKLGLSLAEEGGSASRA